MKVGLALPHYDFSFPEPPTPGLATFGRVADAAARAETLGFHQGWVSDHLWSDLSRYGGPPGQQGLLECWTTLAGLTQRTRKLRLGSLVLAGGLRAPTVLAKMAGTLDQLAGGRLDLGLGAGWNQAEYERNGYPFPSAGERMARLEETLGVLKALLDPAATGTYTGAYYHADSAPVVPGPVQRPWPPLWVGAKGGDGMLALIGRAADGWNVSWRVVPGDYAQRVAKLEERTRAAGRESGAVRRSVGLLTLIGTDADDLARRWRRLQRWAPGGTLDGVSLRDWAATCLVGTPDEIVTQLRGWDAHGVEQVICSFGNLPFALHDPEQLELFGELVIPRLEGGDAA